MEQEIYINPLVTVPLYLVCMAKISWEKRDHRKISYDRRAYESVDDRSHS